MSDPIELAREALRAMSSDRPAVLHISFAALDCLDVLHGPMYKCSRCDRTESYEGGGVLHILNHKVHPDLVDPHWVDLHAAAWDRFIRTTKRDR